MRPHLLLAILWSTAALAQPLNRACIPGDDQGNGLELKIGRGGEAHVSRVMRVGGHLLYSRVAADFTVQTEVVANRISRLAIDEVTDTGLHLDADDTAHICFYNATRKIFEVAHRRGADDWVREELGNGNQAGESCDITRYKGNLVVAWHEAGQLKVATQVNGQWNTVIADAVAGRDVGKHPSIAIGPNDALAISHHDVTDQVLRVAWLDGGWRAGVAHDTAGATGWNSAAAFASDGELIVYHGGVPLNPDVEADIALFVTRGPPGGPYNSGQEQIINTGGRLDQYIYNDVIHVATRLRQRSALFGSADALYHYEGTVAAGVAQQTLEYHGPQTSRHNFQYIQAAPDPWGGPVFAFLDDFPGSFREDPSAKVCFYRHADADADGLPDHIEQQLGTDVNNPDTDNDGRTDGEEVLLDGTDPLSGGACNPSPEVCNNADDDCDGNIDEGLAVACYPANPATEGVGPCRAGTQTCIAGDWGNCIGATVPDLEVCNGADDDCDGTTDEGDPGGGANCDTGLDGICRAGRQQCVAGALGCVALNGAGVEICGGDDEDCDGLVDEGTLVCGIGVCERQIQTCTLGQLNQCRAGAPTGEDWTCDGLDDDCDGNADEAFPGADTQCGRGGCARTGRLVCQAGVVDDTCQPGAPAPQDATCDGVDDDCDGNTDENYVPGVIQCGLGACRRQGAGICVDGVPVGDCTPGQPAPLDDTCDGVDDDCDGRNDEDFAPVETTCGRGACRSAGQSTCVAGALVDDCAALPPAPNDFECDGVDDDCDGNLDEDYSPRPSVCGQGVCIANGQFQCIAGREVDGCVVGEPRGPDSDCDLVDQDCDGAADEGYVATASTCGVGACGASGNVICEAGRERDTCQASPPAADDLNCDGVDDDCDGTADEQFVVLDTACGRGACAAAGRLECRAGVPDDTCQPGQPADGDASCDGIDDDCDGRIDEDYVEQPTTCGLGSCGAQGRLVCQAAVEIDTCRAGAPAGQDRACDGLDNDCDGRADEGFVAQPTLCGDGICAAIGATACADGVLSDTCQAGSPVGPDADCNAVDDDCDGATDESFAVLPTACGSGICAATGERICADGAPFDTCLAGDPANDDIACDGRDDDCDNAIDEDFAPQDTRCGVGQCGASGRTRCAQGQLSDSCDPLAPAQNDATCDGLDDDCDGRIDEDFAATDTRCGQGACAQIGRQECLNGRVVDSCQPGPAAARDASCDGVDDDCDGVTDENYAPQPTACGLGICGREGQTRCAAGRVVDTCEPGPVLAGDPTDRSCDGLDADCDGRLDEGFAGTQVACGVGACSDVGDLICANGQLVNTCTPGDAAPNDASCNGIDEDCDNAVDEDFVVLATECGRGDCAAVGERTCVDGNVTDTCDAGDPALSDADCDGQDDDCDGSADEAYVGRVTRCGQGVCGAVGATICVAGQEGDTCREAATTGPDDLCDGVDSDCDGSTDEAYVSTQTRCGAGACVATGTLSCVGGRQADSCRPTAAAPNDATCDGVDDDCDGDTDEAFQIAPTRCGVGVCRNRGALSCVNGATANSCEAGAPTGEDDDCDGLDDDCDGSTDERFVSAPSDCGVGACAATGRVICQRGRSSDTCTPGEPALDDRTCDGVDDDCDGRIDEDHQPIGIRCGTGACEATGETRCEAGRLIDRCVEGQPAADDSTCDGVDDDCDNTVDEDHAPQDTTCGEGVCGGQGQRRCERGRVISDCRVGAPTGADGDCDGLDNDCDGTADEAFPVRDSTCGAGACRAEGRISCVEGAVVDSCAAGEPTEDTNCDGVDDDCDGAADDDFVAGPVECGVGGCRASGRRACLAGQLTDTCRPSAPAESDATCDGVDDDCDGNIDESAPPRPTVCGEGVCFNEGVLRCEAGAWISECVPLDRAADDAECDGIDTDCDGRTDEGFAPGATTCGEGSCAGIGERICEGGQVLDTCAAFPPGFQDPSCDGVDDDCDTFVDEDFLPRVETCGVGVCARQIVSECIDGVEIGACVPGQPEGDDTVCNGLDDDCDGDTDEACGAFGDGGVDGGPGADSGTDAGTDAGADPDADVVEADAGPRADSQTDAAPSGADADACLGETCGGGSESARVVDDNCGCTVGRSPADNSPFAWLIAGLAGVFIVRRRR